MIIPIADLRKLIDTDEDDFKLGFRINAVERSIRSYTHNHFIIKDSVEEMSVTDGILHAVGPFSLYDTVELFHTGRYDGIYTIEEVQGDGSYLLSEKIPGAKGTVALVRYPADVIAGAVSMISYDISSEGKEGVASETISRHSVSYMNLGQSNTIAGYPMKITSFLKPYRKVAR